MFVWFRNGDYKYIEGRPNFDCSLYSYYKYDAYTKSWIFEDRFSEEIEYPRHAYSWGSLNEFCPDQELSSWEILDISRISFSKVRARNATNWEIGIFGSLSAHEANRYRSQIFARKMWKRVIKSWMHFSCAHMCTRTVRAQGFARVYFSFSCTTFLFFSSLLFRVYIR